MEQIREYFDKAVQAYGAWGLLLMFLIMLLFAVQLHYYLGLFRQLPSFRLGVRKSVEGQGRGISVVIVMNDDYPYVENTLPLLLGQDYELYEVIAVFVGNNNDFAETLEMIAEVEPKFVTTRIKQHPLFPISNKMALNLGIKAARYDNIVITTSAARPVSSRWLSLMARGFDKSEIVIGYCGVEPQKGLADKIIRSSRMFSSLLYITAAIRKKPYRATIHNMGFSKELYFRHKGFGHLNLNLGEDDLFMQQLFTGDNYTIVMHPRATMRQRRWKGLGWWFRENHLRNHSYPLYPVGARNFIEWEAGSRGLFFLAAAAAVVLLPPEIGIAAALLAAVRFTVVLIQMRRVAKRLGEKGLIPLYVINDLFEPLFNTVVAVSRMIKPDSKAWR